MYSEKVMDHFLNSRNVGEIEDADAVAEGGGQPDLRGRAEALSEA